jgi:hypothetical protein
MGNEEDIINQIMKNSRSMIDRSPSSINDPEENYSFGKYFGDKPEGFNKKEWADKITGKGVKAPGLFSGKGNFGDAFKGKEHLTMSMLAGMADDVNRINKGPSQLADIYLRNKKSLVDSAASGIQGSRMLESMGKGYMADKAAEERDRVGEIKSIAGGTDNVEELQRRITKNREAVDQLINENAAKFLKGGR